MGAEPGVESRGSGRDVFITGLGKFLPGPPIGNDQVEAHLGLIRGKPSRALRRVLAQNGIKQRHYAIDGEQRTRFRNAEMAAHAVRDALGHSPIELGELQLLATATSQGDLLLPGFASSVHAELGGPALEVASLHGVCASGVTALKHAWREIGAGGVARAVACASELPSRLLKASLYDDQSFEGALPFDAEFLRWMLSDGAGAVVLQDRPAPRGLSLRVDWIESVSHIAGRQPAMISGANRAKDGTLGPSVLDYPTFAAAAADGAFNLKQDIRQLELLLALGVQGFFGLIERGRVDPAALDWVLVHYSSEMFRGQIVSLLERGGVRIAPERWFSNLATRGNTGSASIYLMLEELVNGGHVRAGQRVFCMVPESGGFITAYMLLTAVEEAGAATRETPAVADRDAPARTPARKPAAATGSTLREQTIRRLTQVWVDFEARVASAPIVRKLERGVFTRDDYRLLLRDLRQQVVEGSRWIARAASSLGAEHRNLRSSFTRHAVDEHRDYEMLERHFVALGGTLDEIERARKNVGSEALSAWMFQRASQPDPFDLLGAMFIIEGAGSRLARRWGTMIRDQLGLTDDDVRFFLYHAENDDTHLRRFDDALDAVLTPAVADAPAVADRIVRTAEVTARLYLLQLEEMGTAEQPGVRR